MDTTRWILAALAVLAYFGAVALQTRSARRGLRVLGRILTLVPFGLSALAFVGALVGAFQDTPGSWADLVLAIFLVPFFGLLFPALYPLAAVWLKPRVAWVVPAGLFIVSATATVLAFRMIDKTGTGGNALALLAVLGAVVLIAVLTWFVAFFRNPRCAPDREAPAPPPAA